VAERLLNGRVRELLAAPHPLPGTWVGVAAPVADPIPVQMESPEQALVPARRLPSGPGETPSERQALQVLMLARRTADEYVALANRHAEATRTDARTAAEQTVREAQDAADRVRQDADRVLSEAQAHAAEMAREAEERYAAVIGQLTDERAALLQQIDELHQFDRDYRTQLRVFMNDQLRALEEGEPAPADTPIPADALPDPT